MTQIIEYAKIRDAILIYHFEFDRNDQTSIGDHFSCSINKYMCLNDWLVVSQALTECIDACFISVSTKSMPKSENIQLPNLNIALNANWIRLDSFYSRLAKIGVTETIHPFVLKLNVISLSTINKFESIDFVQSTSTPKTDENPIEANATKNVLSNNFAQYDLKEAIVVIEKLNIDDYMRKRRDRDRDPRRQSNKRPFSSIDDASQSEHSSIDTNIGSSSTPLLREMSKRLSKLEKGVSRISAIRRRSAHPKVMNPVILATPKVKRGMTRKTRPISLRERFSLQSAKKKRVVQKKTNKKISQKKAAAKEAKVPQTSAKRTRIASPVNSTGFFEEIQPIKKEKNVKTAPALTLPSPPAPSAQDANEIFDLKSISDDDLKQSFHANFTQLNKMFDDYVLQEDTEVIKAVDYDHIDIITLLQSEQIQIMLDMLYNRFVKEDSHQTTSFTNLFFELMVPEWSLASIMAKFSMSRIDAIQMIQQQNHHPNNNVDDSQSLLITQNSLDEDV